MTPKQLVVTAMKAVRALTDEGDQMHRRAVTGRKLVPHLHSTGRVTIRVEGQFVDRADSWLTADGRLEKFRADDAFVAACQEHCDTLGPPVPGPIYVPKRGRPSIGGDGTSGTFTLRLTGEQRAKLDALGGADWVRAQIDQARRPTLAETSNDL